MLVWVDAPHPRFCGFQANGRCCLNGKFALVNPQYPQQYRAQYFQNGDLKKAANEQLWSQGQFNPRGYQGILAQFFFKNKNTIDDKSNFILWETIDSYQLISIYYSQFGLMLQIATANVRYPTIHSIARITSHNFNFDFFKPI